MGFGPTEFGGGRPVNAHLPPLLPNQVYRRADLTVIRLEFANDHPSMAIRHEFGGDVVGQTAFLANLPHEPPLKLTASKNLVQDSHGIPFWIVAFRAPLPESDAALR